MKIRTALRNAAGLTACAAIGLTAFAQTQTVQFNNTGSPIFIGKGTVQHLFSWNNNQFQACVNTNTTTGCLEFKALKESGTSWRCIRFNNNQTVVQTRSSTFTVQGIAPVVARSQTGGQQQITGFWLTTAETLANVSGGDPLFTCPSGTGWAIVSHCFEINAQGQQSPAIIEGCTTDNQNRASWSSGGGTLALEVRDTRDSNELWHMVPIN